MASAVDLQLVELSRIAERGDACPPVRLLLGSTVVAGAPTATKTFSEVMVEAVGAEAWQALVGQNPSAKKAAQHEAQYLAGIAPVEAAMHRLRDEVTPDPDAVLTLASAQIWPAAGSALSVPALRVPLDRVDAWWMAGNEEGASGGGWSFFAGGIVPLGD